MARNLLGRRHADDGPPLLGSGLRVALNERAADLLCRCDGSQTAPRLAHACLERDAALEFLAAARELGWVIALEGGAPDPASGPARR